MINIGKNYKRVIIAASLALSLGFSGVAKPEANSKVELAQAVSSPTITTYGNADPGGGTGA